MTNREEFQQWVDTHFCPYSDRKNMQSSIKLTIAKFGIDKNNFNVCGSKASLPGNKGLRIIIWSPADYFDDADDNDVNFDFYVEA